MADLIDNADDLSEAVEAAPQARRRGWVAAAIQAISLRPVAGTDLDEAWEEWCPQLAAIGIGPAVAKCFPDTDAPSRTRLGTRVHERRWPPVLMMDDLRAI
jgi:hypothetical protein